MKSLNGEKIYLGHTARARTALGVQLRFEEPEVFLDIIERELYYIWSVHHAHTLHLHIWPQAKQGD